ncbi:hypothetical protein Tco_0745762 [Tanacetum coccineum]
MLVVARLKCEVGLNIRLPYSGKFLRISNELSSPSYAENVLYVLCTLINGRRLGRFSVANNMALSYDAIMRSMESYVLQNVFATGGALLNETGRATYVLVLYSDIGLEMMLDDKNRLDDVDLMLSEAENGRLMGLGAWMAWMGRNADIKDWNSVKFCTFDNIWSVGKNSFERFFLAYEATGTIFRLVSLILCIVLLPKNNTYDQVSHVKCKTIIQTFDDDQIDSNIIFDDLYVENNGGTSDHDSNAHDEYHEIQMLAYNVQKEAENQKRLNNELKKQKMLLQKELETCKDRVKMFESKTIQCSKYKETCEELERELRDDKNTIEIILKEKDTIQSDFFKIENEKIIQHETQLAKKASKERENRYLEDIVDLEENLSSHDQTIYKMGQSIQTIHMLGKKPNKVYDPFLKVGLGYKNLERLRKAIAAQPKMYDDEMLHSAKLNIDSPDSEETLEDAEEIRLKMRNKMVQLNYGKLNSKEVTSDLPIPKMPKESKLLKMFDKMGVAINGLRARIDKTLLEDRQRRWMSDSQNLLREFYKTDVISMSASLSKNLKELKEELIEEVHKMLNIFESMEQKVNEKSSKENILQNEIDRLLEVSLTNEIQNCVLISVEKQKNELLKA